MKKEAPLLKKSLSFISQFAQGVLASNVKIPLSQVHGYMERYLWQMISASENKTLSSEVFFYEGKDYRHHGFGSWRKFTNNVTLSYLAED